MRLYRSLAFNCLPYVVCVCVCMYISVESGLFDLLYGEMLCLAVVHSAAFRKWQNEMGGVWFVSCDCVLCVVVRCRF